MHRRQKFCSSSPMPKAMCDKVQLNEAVPDAIIKQARKSGQLNLASRELTTVPDKVWRINIDVPEEGKSASLEKADDRWWEQIDLTKLILASNKITNISSDIQQLPALVVLDLHDNEITCLPNEVGELVNLKRLNISYNRLTSLPSQIGNLSSLVSLLLQHNQLKNLVDNIGRLSKLEELMSDRRMSSLHEASKMGFVLKLDPSGSGNRCYYRCLATFLNQSEDDVINTLETFMLKRQFIPIKNEDVSNNSLDVLPLSLGSLMSLRKLILSNNSLTKSPAEFGKMLVLCELDLSNNKLGQLPEGVGNLEKLGRLDCRYNQLTKVPMLKSCKFLKELYLGYNQITSMDAREISCLSSVTIFDIRDNRISQLPNGITAMGCLERLDLSNNNLSGLPYEMGKMTKLKSVILDGNPLRSIRRDIIMKGTVAILQHLNNKIPEDEKKDESTSQADSPSVNTHLLNTNKKLSYSQQKAVSIPDDVWEASEGTRVATIDLSKNLLENIPLKICNFEETLTSVNLGSNRISKIPPEFCLLSHLTHLDVRNNHLSAIPDEFKLLSELREIILSHNRFTSLPDVLYSLPKLDVILASNNQIAVINVNGVLKLKHLTSLDLSNNSISVVPPELGKAETLRSLQLEGNLFRNPRLAILKKGTAALLEYLKDRIPA